MAPSTFRNHRILGNVNASSENFRIFTVRKVEGFEIHRKIFELGPPYSTSAMAPLSVTLHLDAPALLAVIYV